MCSNWNEHSPKGTQQLAMHNRDWPFPDKFHLRWRFSSATVRFATVLVVKTVLSKSVHVVDRLAFWYKTFLCRNSYAASLAWPELPLCYVSADHTRLLALGVRPQLPVVIIKNLHPLTRRNGLVNQVEFLGLAHTFATM